MVDVDAGSRYQQDKRDIGRTISHMRTVKVREPMLAWSNAYKMLNRRLDDAMTIDPSMKTNQEAWDHREGDTSLGEADGVQPGLADEDGRVIALGQRPRLHVAAGRRREPDIDRIRGKWFQDLKVKKDVAVHGAGHHVFLDSAFNPSSLLPRYRRGQRRSTSLHPPTWTGTQARMPTGPSTTCFASCCRVWKYSNAAVCGGNYPDTALGLPWGVLGLAFICCLLPARGVTAGSSFAFDVYGGQEECFREDIVLRSLHSDLFLHFELLEPRGPADALHVKLLSPSGVPVTTWAHATANNTSLQLRESGLYSLCFTSTPGSKAHQRVLYVADVVSYGTRSLTVRDSSVASPHLPHGALMCTARSNGGGHAASANTRRTVSVHAHLGHRT
ncbi:hypothetical protein AaE_014246, partial [Aphanomyces astaci]